MRPLTPRSLRARIEDLAQRADVWLVLGVVSADEHGAIHAILDELAALHETMTRDLAARTLN